MINVNQITSQLARMPDQALQQYATMHKNDPYTVSLALAESNRRKEMRMGAQAQGGAPQPKVVDSDIAAMMPQAPQAPQMPQGQAQAMPEDVGIGALPAPNMQGMADGGIVAFADRGLVDDPMNPESPLSIGTAWRKWRESGQPLLQYLGGSTAPAVSDKYADETKRGAAADVVPPQAPGAPVLPSIPGITTAAAAAPRAAAGPRVAAGPRAPATPADLSYEARLQKAMGTEPIEDPFAKQREGVTATAKAGREEGLAKLKADQEAEMAGMFKGREERIGKREGELEKSKETNTGLAFLEAGLAMMQSRGPGLSGIAQGAGVGVKQYAAGIDKIKSAQEKLDEARDRMEELRQNQSSMNKREIRAEEKDIRDIVTQGQRDTLAGAEKAYGIKREDMRAAVTSDVATRQAELDRQNRLQVAGMPGDQQKMLTALGGKGGLEAGLRMLTEIQAGKVTPLQSYEKYIQAFAGKDTALAPPMTPQQYASMISQFTAAQDMMKPPPSTNKPTGAVIP